MFIFQAVIMDGEATKETANFVNLETKLNEKHPNNRYYSHVGDIDVAHILPPCYPYERKGQDVPTQACPR
jgi:hypothetical protein